MTFSINIPAKCILAGEHVILEQGFAIVSPFKQYQLSLSYLPDTIKSKYTISAEGENSLSIILWPAICKAFELLEQDVSALTGVFDIQSTIPPCGGLGFSAALCVAVTEWVIYYGLLPKSSLFEFSIALEHMFHGKSSGVDVAGVLSENIIQYFATREIMSVNQRWTPHLYVSRSGETSFTGPCVKKVHHLRQSEPDKAKIIDNKMLSASLHIKLALETSGEEQLPLLAHGLDLGNECFYDWNLVSPKLHDHVTELKKHALSCKIVGAGYGGHVISLWKEEPPANLPFELWRLA